MPVPAFLALPTLGKLALGVGGAVAGSVAWEVGMDVLSGGFGATKRNRDAAALTQASLERLMGSAGRYSMSGYGPITLSAAPTRLKWAI